VAVGVEVTGAWYRLTEGTGESCCNVNRKIQANISASMKVGMNSIGAEESVVVVKPL